MNFPQVGFDEILSSYASEPRIVLAFEIRPEDRARRSRAIDLTYVRAEASGAAAVRAHELEHRLRQRPVLSADGVGLRDVRVPIEMHALDGLAGRRAGGRELVGLGLEIVGVELGVGDERSG